MRRYFLLVACAETVPGEMGARPLALLPQSGPCATSLNVVSVFKEKVRCFGYNVAPECKPATSSGVQLSQQQCCPTLGQSGGGGVGLATPDLVREVRLHYCALLKHFSGGFDDT